MDKTLQTFNDFVNPPRENVIKVVLNIDILTTEIEPSNLINDTHTYTNEMSEVVNTHGS